MLVYGVGLFILNVLLTVEVQAVGLFQVKIFRLCSLIDPSRFIIPIETTAFLQLTRTVQPSFLPHIINHATLHSSLRPLIPILLRHELLLQPYGLTRIHLKIINLIIEHLTNGEKLLLIVNPCLFVHLLLSEDHQDHFFHEVFDEFSGHFLDVGFGDVLDFGLV